MNEEGSAFLETIIAAALLAGILGVTFETLQAAADRARKANLREQATLVAQSRLAQYPVTSTVRPDRLGGSDGGFHWQVEIVPDRMAGGRSGLMRVEVMVAPDAEPAVAVRLGSLRPGGAG